ncbi:hypothetical protein LSH36_806g01021 [Paralvinella palmiformis]|uniref:Uncharacterized protein n=1 Tax=Paralvinella palmiformis TaxID=53620 RepID=A0AAD9J0U8_9ANNE|nr:hypothetical protein LSH36_806g01021 [Paralvinella palmiformis]
MSQKTVSLAPAMTEDGRSVILASTYARVAAADGANTSLDQEKSPPPPCHVTSSTSARGKRRWICATMTLDFAVRFGSLTTVTMP